MSESVWVALIAAVPPTIAACAALWQARKLSRPLEDVNRAVNHRPTGSKTLIETVDQVASDVADLRAETSDINYRLRRHLAYHQEELEEDKF